MATYLREIPYTLLRHAHRDLRRTLFTKPRPTGQYVIVADSVDAEAVLGRQSFAPNWEFSYNYRDEDLNLARVVHDDDTQFAVEWWQTHVRGWKHDGYWWFRAHYEPEPTEHPKEHLDTFRPENRSGRRQLVTALDRQNVEWRTTAWEG